MIVPGGGISPDGQRWISAGRASSCRCGCCALFRRLFLTQLLDPYPAGRLAFFGTRQGSPTPASSCSPCRIQEKPVRGL